MIKSYLTLVGQRDRSGLLENSPTKLTASGRIDAFNGSTSIETPSGILCSLEEEEEEESSNNDVKEVYCFSSRLSKALPEILTDKSALGYFIQFMDTRKHVALIKFWLEVECLCSASGISSCTETAECTNQKELSDTLPTPIDNNKSLNRDILSGNVDAQTSSKICDENMGSNSATSILNGMPKTSQMLSETRQSNHNCESKRHNMTTSRQDALRIYKKYILKEALDISQISEELRLNIEEAVAQENIEPILRCLSVIQSIVYDILENE